MEHGNEELFGDELQGELLASNLFNITMGGAVLFIVACIFSVMG